MLSLRFCRPILPSAVTNGSCRPIKYLYCMCVQNGPEKVRDKSSDTTDSKNFKQRCDENDHHLRLRHRLGPTLLWRKTQTPVRWRDAVLSSSTQTADRTGKRQGRHINVRLVGSNGDGPYSALSRKRKPEDSYIHLAWASTPNKLKKSVIKMRHSCTQK